MESTYENSLYGIHLSTWNRALLVLRYILCAVPLSGYIHPDQFFQSTEPMAGTFLDYNVTYTWEWTIAFPIRNAFFPLVSAGMPFLLLRQIEYYYMQFSPYFLLILPRLIMTLFLNISDLLLWKILQFVYEEKDSRHHFTFFLWRSSYVTLVFLTCTFSNAFEVLCFALLLFRLTSVWNGYTRRDHIHCTHTVYLDLGVIVTAGFFIRLTFLVYCFFPLMLTFIQEMWHIKNHQGIKEMCKTIISYMKLFLFGAVPTAMAFIALDTVFHSKDEYKIHITPLEFLRYNSNTENLRQHGLHPWYIHFLSNMTMLFGPAYVVVILSSVMIIVRKYGTSYEGKIELKPKHNNLTQGASDIKNVEKFIAFIFTPTALLSLIPHQEPRFIIPTIIPVVIVTGLIIGKQCKRYFKLFIFSWITFNGAMSMLFGIFHQGGLVPCAVHLNGVIHSSVNSTSDTPQVYHLVFWKTYTMPKYLFQLKRYHPGQPAVRVHNLMGASEESFLHTINNLRENKDSQVKDGKNKVFVAMPSTVWRDFDFCKVLNTFWPHLTLDNPPWESRRSISSYWNITSIIETHLSLFLCEVT